MQNNKLFSLVVSLLLLEPTSSMALNSASMSEADLANALQKLTEQTAQMQEEISTLRAELRKVKQSKSAKHTESSLAQAKTPKVSRQKRPVTVATNQAVRETNTVDAYTTGMSPSVVAQQKILSPKEEMFQEQEEAINFVIGSTVLSSPILNIHSAYDASDLLVNQSTMNEDLRFLLQRQELERFLGAKASLPSATRPRVFLSGKVESQFLYFDPFGGPASTSIELSTVELDVLAEASPWAYGFMSINFENNPLRNPATIGSGNPINNSRLFLKRGFLTIGNLDKSPVYFSMGQEYVPFGDYSSYMLSNPVTISEGRINNRAAVLGYYKGGLYLSTYALNGAVNTEEGFDANHVYEWGVNGGYKYASDSGFFKTNIGSGYTTNIAEAQGYQLTGLSSQFFQGFGAHPDTEIITYPVGGFDVHAAVTFGPVSLVSEYITATRNFDEEDLTFNEHGAKPSALHTELDYTFELLDQAFALWLAYDHTWQSLALNLPKDSYIAGLSTSIWKNTIEAIEYRHDVNYADGTTSGGICDPSGGGTATFCPVPVFGSTQNQFIFQIGVYF